MLFSTVIVSNALIYILSGYRPYKGHGNDDDDDGRQQIGDNEHDKMEREGSRQEEEQDLKSTCDTDNYCFATESSEVDKVQSTDQFGSKMAEFQNEIQELKQQYRQQLITKCHQLKIHRTKDDDVEEVIQDFDNCETQPVLDKLKLTEDPWRTMDLWEIVQQVNPSPNMKFDPEVLLRDETLTELESDTILKRSIVLCCIFEDLTRKLGWKVGDTLDIEEDICDVVGKLISEMEESDRSSFLDCI